VFYRVPLAACLLLGPVISAYGQRVDRRAVALPQIQLVPIQLTGTIAGVKPGMIAVTTAAGETWALSIPPKIEVRVTGTAEPDVLSPGMYVRFIAAVDKQRGLVQGKVEKLVIFSPSEGTGRMPGVFYSGQEGDEAAVQPNAGMPPNPPEARNPGVRPSPRRQREPATPPKAGPTQGVPGREADTKDKAAAQVETFDVRGRITAVKGRWLTVYARNTLIKPALKIELADKPEIKLDVDTYTLAKAGDKISARGVQMGAQAVQAIQVAIELVEPLGAAGKRAGRPIGKRPSRPSSKAGEDRQPFEVSQEAGQAKPGQNKDAPPPKEPVKPVPQDERSKQIVQYVQAKPEEYLRGVAAVAGRKPFPNAEVTPTMLSRALFAVCICAGLLPPAQGQGVRPGRNVPAAKAVKPELEPFTAEGTIQAVARGRIQMSADAAKSWTVMVDPKAVVHVTGTAEPDFLRAGLSVRFTAELDKGGVAKEKVQQLTIITPSPENLPGVWPEGEGPAAGKALEGERRGGIDADNGPVIRKAPEGERRRGSGAGDGPAAGKVLASGVYTVAGRITSFRKGKLTVNAGRSTVRADVADDAKIDVDFADYSVAKQGDKISVTKGATFAGRAGLAQAQELTIQLSEPLAPPKKKTVRSKLPAIEGSRRTPKKAGSREEPIGGKELDSDRGGTR